MAKQKSQPESIAIEDEEKATNKPLPSFKEFREAVKYALTHDHGMPPLYAEEVLDRDADFLEQQRKTYHDHSEDSEDVGAIARAADGLRFEPPCGLKWVALQEGQSIAEQDQIVLDTEGAVGKYLDSLIEIGLHGSNRGAVASAMLAKGIETVFPLILSRLKK